MYVILPSHKPVYSHSSSVYQDINNNLTFLLEALQISQNHGQTLENLSQTLLQVISASQKKKGGDLYSFVLYTRKRHFMTGHVKILVWEMFVGRGYFMLSTPNSKFYHLSPSHGGAQEDCVCQLMDSTDLNHSP